MSEFKNVCVRDVRFDGERTLYFMELDGEQAWLDQSALDVLGVKNPLLQPKGLPTRMVLNPPSVVLQKSRSVHADLFNEFMLATEQARINNINTLLNFNLA